MKKLLAWYRLLTRKNIVQEDNTKKYLAFIKFGLSDDQEGTAKVIVCLSGELDFKALHARAASELKTSGVNNIAWITVTDMVRL